MTKCPKRKKRRKQILLNQAKIKLRKGMKSGIMATKIQVSLKIRLLSRKLKAVSNRLFQVQHSIEAIPRVPNTEGAHNIKTLTLTKEKAAARESPTMTTLEVKEGLLTDIIITILHPKIIISEEVEEATEVVVATLTNNIISLIIATVPTTTIMSIQKTMKILAQISMNSRTRMRGIERSPTLIITTISSIEATTIMLIITIRDMQVETITTAEATTIKVVAITTMVINERKGDEAKETKSPRLTQVNYMKTNSLLLLLMFLYRYMLKSPRCSR